MKIDLKMKLSCEPAAYRRIAKTSGDFQPFVKPEIFLYALVRKDSESEEKSDSILSTG